MTTRTKHLIYGSILTAIALAPAIMSAAAILPNPTPPISTTGVTVSEVLGYIEQLARILITISLVLAVIFIIWGGIQYMVAGGEEKATAAAKKRIWNGIIGAAVVLGVGVILQTVAGIFTRQTLQ